MTDNPKRPDEPDAERPPLPEADEPTASTESHAHPRPFASPDPIAPATPRIDAEPPENTGATEDTTATEDSEEARKAGEDDSGDTADIPAAEVQPPSPPSEPARENEENEENEPEEPVKAAEPVPVVPTPVPTPVPVPVPAPAAPPRRERLMSLDALRGFDMFWIVGAAYIVRALESMNVPTAFQVPFLDGFFTVDVIQQLQHVAWEGFRFYDLIFPLFVFIVGVSLTYSVGRTIEERGRTTAVVRIFRRSIILFAIGVIYNGGFANEWPDVRLMGVLGRIALCYFFTALLFTFFRWRALVLICLGLLAGYWGLMALVPVPEIGAGSYAPGANLANYIDEQYLPGRKYDGTWDPEGLLSTLPAIGSCLLGVFAGLLIQNSRMSNARKILLLLAGGVALILTGWGWGLHFFPVIKKIWTSSYVLVAGGFSAILLALFYMVVDVWKWRWWTAPFVWIGLNPITIYLANELIGFRRLADRFAGGSIQDWLNSQYNGLGDMTLSVLALSFALILAGFLHRKRVYIRL